MAFGHYGGMAGQASFLGIDLGTSNLKLVVANEQGRILASAEARLPIARPKPGWSEQNPQDWWKALVRLCRKLKAEKPKAWASVEAIGLSGQMHAAVLLDGAAQVLRPAILWSDSRADRQAHDLNAGVPGLGTLAGVPAMASFTAPKLLWLKSHEPKCFGSISHVLAAKDYLRFRLTDDFVTDPSEAAGMLLLDEERRQWSYEIVAACGIDMAMLPRIVEGSEAAGRLAEGASRILGLRAGIVVAGSAGDAAAGAISLGAVADGDGFISLGTAAQYFVSTSSYRPAPKRMVHAFCHGLPQRWFQMAALLNGASPLGWLERLLAIKDLKQALGQLERRKQAPSPVMFLPYLDGERTPHNDPHARGLFHSLAAETTREDLLQAVLDGVALALADCQDVLAESETRVDELSVIGGGAKSAYWMKLIASALNRPLLQHEGVAFGPAFGAARLARLALTGEDVSAVCRKLPISETVLPDPRLTEAYAERLPVFRELYSSLRGLNRVA